MNGTQGALVTTVIVLLSGIAFPGSTEQTDQAVQSVQDTPPANADPQPDDINGSYPSSSTRVVAEHGEDVRVVGGVWRLGNMSEDLKIRLRYEMPPGRSMVQLLLLALDPQKEEFVLKDVARSQQAEAGMWVHRGDVELSQSIQLDSSSEVVDVNTTVDQEEYGEGKIFVLLLHASAPTTLGYEILNLPADSTRLDRHRIVRGWEDMGYQGAGATAPYGYAAVEEGTMLIETDACAYGAIGSIRWGSTAASRFQVEGPDERFDRYDLLGPRFLAFGAPAGAWTVSSEWLGVALHSPLPYVSLFIGDCPAGA